MGKLPRLTGRAMVRLLQHRGFTVVRVHGSHHFLQCASLQTCVPVHGNRNLKIGTLRSILRDIDLSPTAFEKAVQGM